MFLQCIHDFLLSLGILSLNLSDFWVKQVDFLPILTLIQWFLYILSDEVHKYQDFQSIIIALKNFLKFSSWFCPIFLNIDFLVSSKNSSISARKNKRFLAIYMKLEPMTCEICH
jgi:hypothetical protein